MPPQPDERTDHQETIASLYREYGPDLRRFMRQRVSSPECVNDLVQQIFLRILARKDLTHVRDGKAYVFKVACHLLSRLRTRQAREAVVVTIDSEAMEAAAASPADVRSNPQLDALGRRDLEHALSRLSLKQRAAIELQLDGVPYARIAKELSLSIKTVGPFLTRARQQLAQELWVQKDRCSYDTKK